MRVISTRDLRNTPGKVREMLEDEDLVLTSGSTPIAYLTGIGEGERIEEVAAAIRKARAQLAVHRMRRDAAEEGLDQLTPEEIEEEIRAVREDRPGAP